MKKLLFSIIVLAMSLTMNAQNSEGITLTVVIENVLNSEGHVLSGLHNEDTFMKAEGIKTSKDKAEAGELVLKIFNPVIMHFLYCTIKMTITEWILPLTECQRKIMP